MNKKNFKSKTIILSLVFAMLITLVPVSTGVKAEDTEIFNISESVQSTTAHIKWYTNKSIEGELKYGREDQGLRSVITTDKRTDWHRYTLRDLKPNTAYKYEAVAKDSNGKVLTSQKGEFKTKGSGTQEIKDIFYVDFDSSLYGHNGDLPAKILNQDELKFVKPAVYNSALQVKSDNSHVTYHADKVFGTDPYNKAFSPDHGYVSAWLRIEKFNKDMVVWETNDSNFAMYLENFDGFSRIVARVGDGEAKYYFNTRSSGSNVWTPGEWHLVTMTWEGRNNGNLELYIDGRRRDEVVYDKSNLPSQIMIGNNFRHDMAWSNGQIDEFKLSNWAIPFSYVAGEMNWYTFDKHKDVNQGVIAGATVRKFSYGKLFKTPNSKVYVVTRDNQVLHVSDLNALKRFKSHPIITNASYDELDQYTMAGEFYAWSRYPDGTLLKGSGPTVYWVWDNEKRPIADASVFNRYGNDWADVITVSDSELGSYPTGFTYY